MLNELYTFAEPVQVVPFSSLKWGKFTLLHTVVRRIKDTAMMLLFYNSYNKDSENFGLGTTLVLHFHDLKEIISDTII